MSHEPLAIANKVLQAAHAEGKTLTIMQLIKLVYIAHGWTLSLLNRPLVNKPPEAWQHGPVYPEIYNEYRGYGSSPIDRTAKHPFSGADYETELDEDEESIVRQVVKAYGKLHAFTLSARTHQPGTPWYRVYAGGAGKFSEIPNGMIKAHFDGLNGAGI